MVLLFSLLLIVGSVTRLLPHPANFAPIAALGIFAGLYGTKKQAILLPLAARFISDALIGFDTPVMMLAIYAATILGSFLGIWAKKHKNFFGITAATLTGSISFFILTNVAVWLFTPLYAKTLIGLHQSIVLALPFFRNTLLSDLAYVGVFVVSFEVAKKLIQLKKQNQERKKLCLSN